MTANNSPGKFALCLAAVALAATTNTADARPRPAGRQSSFQANKTFGLGLMIGAPTGLSGKYFLSPSNALDFGVGGMRYYRGRSGLHLHLDYLWHPFSIAKSADFELPLYFGLGARVFDFDEGPYDDTLGLGLRAPLGVAVDFNNVPLDIFFEVALVMDYYRNYSDDFGVDLNGAIGFRYWFK